MQRNKPSNKRHSFQPLLFAPPQGFDALPKSLPKTSKKLDVVTTSIPNTPSNDAPRHRAASGDRVANKRASHVRLCVAPAAGLGGNVEWLEAQDLLDELCEDQLTLTMNLACLERAAQDRPRDPSTRAALRSLDARIGDLGTVRDALAVLQLSTVSKTVHRAFLPDAPLSDYLRGVYAWTHAVIRALNQLVEGLCIMQPDWASYRWRIEEAKNFHFDELEELIEDDLVQLLAESGDEEAVGQLAASFEALLFEARELEQHLEERFG